MPPDHLTLPLLCLAAFAAGLVDSMVGGGSLVRLPGIALPMAACNALGSALGTRLALRYGTGLVRGLFLAVVSVFILRLGWEVLG